MYEYFGSYVMEIVSVSSRFLQNLLCLVDFSCDVWRASSIGMVSNHDLLVCFLQFTGLDIGSDSQNESSFSFAHLILESTTMILLENGNFLKSFLECSLVSEDGTSPEGSSSHENSCCDETTTTHFIDPIERTE
ncbi:hypothetical protein PENTCL1PPCAC_22733 [Pristionchus entomophagus]|uniref:Uncharacterized protein n=1 Tax=Pristionchus entomophagus TaxID=358040 RepID=A0AAV5U134_9BILA|nr:hypothetical protein PENTCL1PPCAC_22733 [Pristionchus entomophagus]